MPRTPVSDSLMNTVKKTPLGRISTDALYSTEAVSSKFNVIRQYGRGSICDFWKNYESFRILSKRQCHLNFHQGTKQ